jgi:hypothetical protein
MSRMNHLRFIGMAALASLLASSSIACSSPSSDTEAANANAITVNSATAQYLLEGYGSGSPDTGVDEWDVALVPRGGKQFLVARGFKDAVSSDGTLDPTRRTAQIDIVLPASGSQAPSFEVPDTDNPKKVDPKAYPALMDDFSAMKSALAYQQKLAAANPTGIAPQSLSGIHITSDTTSATNVAACGSGSKTAATVLEKIENWFSFGDSAPEPTTAPTDANNGTLKDAQHVCPVQTNNVPVTGTGDKSDIEGMLGGVKSVKRFFERNRKLLAKAIQGDREQFLALLRCLFGKVVTGIFLFADVSVPTEGLADLVASKGATLPGNLLPKATSLVPALAGAADLEVGVWGGMDISGGVTSPELLGGFDLAVSHGFRIPFVGNVYLAEGVGIGYNFTTKEWEEPEMETEAGDIPLSVGPVEAGLGVFWTAGDAVGVFVDFELAAGAADWGIEVDLSKSGMAAFWNSMLTGDFVTGCSTTNDEGSTDGDKPTPAPASDGDGTGAATGSGDDDSASQP